MRFFVFVSGLVATAIFCSFTPACTNSGASSSSGDPSGEGGTSGSSGTSGTSGASGGEGGAANALPATTFLFVSRQNPDHDVLMAFDVTNGQTRVVTDLRSDGSEGWTMGGYSLSRDRTRIVLASIYGPTKEDVATRLSTRRIWTLATDGSDFKRLTPVFENNGGGKTNFAIEVSDPHFSRNGQDVLYEYGEYWYEGTSLQGGAGIWSVSAAGGKLPSLFRAPSPCSLVSPSIDPATGKVAIIHSVCVPGQGQQNGIYLYAAEGTGTPEKLVESDYNTLDIALEPPGWVADGSGFVFVAGTTIEVGGTRRLVRSLFVFDMGTRKATAVVAPTEPDTRVTDAAAAPDASAIVYCLDRNGSTDLHLIDLTKDPATDTAITNDGKSCHPVW